MRIGLVPIRGRSFVEADRICDQWVEMLVSSRAPHLPDTTGHIFLGPLINRFFCFVRVDAASKLTNQVEESFCGRRLDQVALDGATLDEED